MTAARSLAPCSVCGGIANAAMACPCSFKLSYCGKCYQSADQVWKLHLVECDAAQRATRPARPSVVAWWRLLGELGIRIALAEVARG